MKKYMDSKQQVQYKSPFYVIYSGTIALSFISLILLYIIFLIGIIQILSSINNLFCEIIKFFIYDILIPTIKFLFVDLFHTIFVYAYISLWIIIVTLICVILPLFLYSGYKTKPTNDSFETYFNFLYKPG